MCPFFTQLRNARLGHFSRRRGSKNKFWLTGTLPEWRNDSWRAAKGYPDSCFPHPGVGPPSLDFSPKWSAPAVGRLRVFFTPSSVCHLTLNNTSHFPPSCSLRLLEVKAEAHPQTSRSGGGIQPAAGNPTSQGHQRCEGDSDTAARVFFFFKSLGLLCAFLVFWMFQNFAEWATWKSQHFSF